MNMDTNTLTLPKCWQDLDDILAAKLGRICLHGLPGIGKTYTAQTSHLSAAGVHKIACVDDMTTGQIEGLWKPAREGWEFHEGAAVKAWRTGGRLLIDEIDKASGEVLGSLLQFCDSEGSARWEHPDTREVVTPAAGFTVVITTNAHPNSLAEALRDRFPVAIEINEAHPAAIALLPQWLQEPARQLCRAKDDDRLSLRAFFAIAHLSTTLGISRAVELVAPQHLEALTTAAAVSALATSETVGA
jgi:MoxR-like ATPase